MLLVTDQDGETSVTCGAHEPMMNYISTRINRPKRGHADAFLRPQPRTRGSDPIVPAQGGGTSSRPRLEV
jgi:hypothetical protein